MTKAGEGANVGGAVSGREKQPWPVASSQAQQSKFPTPHVPPLSQAGTGHFVCPWPPSSVTSSTGYFAVKGHFHVIFPLSPQCCRCSVGPSVLRSVRPTCPFLGNLFVRRAKGSFRLLGKCSHLCVLPDRGLPLPAASLPELPLSIWFQTSLSSWPGRQDPVTI